MFKCPDEFSWYTFTGIRRSEDVLKILTLARRKKVAKASIKEVLIFQLLLMRSKKERKGFQQ